MKIGIDARTILNPEKGDGIGIGHYTYQLIRHLLEIDTKNSYTLFFDYRVRDKDIKKFTRENTRIKFYPFSDYKKYIPGAYNEILGRATLAREDLDVLHSTSPLSRVPMGYKGAIVTTFHNLGVFSYPKAFSRLKRTRMQALTKYMVACSQKAIASSSFVARELETFAGCSRDKIRVISSGLDKRFSEDLVDSDRDIEKVTGKFGIKKKYILFLGTISPINNVTRLLEAFDIFKQSFLSGKKKKFPYQLVLAGKNGGLSKECRQTVKDRGLTKDVVFTGYVIGDDLVPLFRGSEFFVMPSLYEGFGTTVLEAFATKTPTIASQTSSLIELTKDVAYPIDPLDVDGMAKAFSEFAKNKEIRDEYAQKGFERSKDYGWEKVARETLHVYEEIHTG